MVGVKWLYTPWRPSNYYFTRSFVARKINYLEVAAVYKASLYYRPINNYFYFKSVHCFLGRDACISFNLYTEKVPDHHHQFYDILILRESRSQWQQWHTHIYYKGAHGGLIVRHAEPGKGRNWHYDFTGGTKNIYKFASGAPPG